MTAIRTASSRIGGGSIGGKARGLAFGRFLLTQRGLLGRQDPEAREQLTALTRTIVESPALQAREAQILAGYTASLAALLAEETDAPADDLRPWVTANAMMGAHRALIDHTRRRIVAGESEHRFDVRQALRK